MVPPRLSGLLVLSVLALSACPHVPINFGSRGQASTADELLGRIALAEGSVLSAKGDGRLTVDSPQGKGSVDIFVAVAHPAFIHLEQLDFFGRPQSVLVTDGQQFGLYDAQAGKYLRGPASSANLGRFLPLGMPPAELAGLLLGRAPRLPATSSDLRFDREQGVYVATLRRGAATQTLTVRPPLDRVATSAVAGFEAYDLVFSDVVTRGLISFPRRVALDARGANTRVELTWKEFALNEEPDQTLFELTPPEGVPVIDLDAEGRALSPASGGAQAP